MIAHLFDEKLNFLLYVFNNFIENLQLKTYAYITFLWQYNLSNVFINL